MHSTTASGMNSVREGAGEQIARLQDEVQRIGALLAGLVDESSTDVGFGRNFFESKPIAFVPARRENTHSRFSMAEPLHRDRRSPHEFPSAPVRRVLQVRRLREQFFPADMFSDPAWDMLLDLYAAQLEGQTVAVSSLCIAAAVPSTTALRWIKSMTDAGMLERHDDPHDRRRAFICLSQRSAQAMERYFAALERVK